MEMASGSGKTVQEVKDGRESRCSNAELLNIARDIYLERVSILGKEASLR